MLVSKLKIYFLHGFGQFFEQASSIPVSDSNWSRTDLEQSSNGMMQETGIDSSNGTIDGSKQINFRLM